VIAALFSERRTLPTLALWLGFFLALLMLYLLLGWLPSLMVGRGLTRPQASMVQIAFNALGALGSVATGLILDRGKRKLIVAAVFALASVCIAYLAHIQAVFALAVLAGFLVGAGRSPSQVLAGLLLILALSGFAALIVSVSARTAGDAKLAAV
jgi:AAHS family 3-hydroxyphenylpropionic acid transporter